MIHPIHRIDNIRCSEEYLSIADAVGAADGVGRYTTGCCAVMVKLGITVTVEYSGVMVGYIPHEHAAHSFFGYSTQFNGISMSV
jgi:hypothetical protein